LKEFSILIDEYDEQMMIDWLKGVKEKKIDRVSDFSMASKLSAAYGVAVSAGAVTGSHEE